MNLSRLFRIGGGRNNSKPGYGSKYPLFKKVRVTTGSPLRPEEMICYICHEEFGEAETLTHKDCRWSFHRTCWEDWMMASAPCNCPIERDMLDCRTRVIFLLVAKNVRLRAILSRHLDALSEEYEEDFPSDVEDNEGGADDESVVSDGNVDEDGNGTINGSNNENSADTTMTTMNTPHEKS